MIIFKQLSLLNEGKNPFGFYMENGTISDYGAKYN